MKSEQLEENQKKKEYLSGYLKAKRKEQRILDQIQQLRMDKMFPGIQYSDMPGGSGNMSDLSDFAVKMEELMDLLKCKSGDCDSTKHKIIRRIDCMHDDVERDVLTLRYVQLKSWEEIKSELNISSIRQTFRVHGRALNNFTISD